MANSFLNKSGLSYFWAKIKAYVDGKFLAKPSGGTPGQVLTKTSAGGENWEDPASGLPDGGAQGQMLYQGVNGAEWADKPVMYVNITGDDESGYQADKTFAEIQEAYQNGYAVFAQHTVSGAIVVMPLFGVTSDTIVTFVHQTGDTTYTAYVYADDYGGGAIGYAEGGIYASGISLISGTTGLTSDNVQDAIEEVQGNIVSAQPIQVPVTLSASAWSSNQQTVSVSGVLADETKQLIQIVPAIASQTAYFDAGIRCVNQGADSLTFECQETPTENVSAFAVITNLRASS